MRKLIGFFLTMIFVLSLSSVALAADYQTTVTYRGVGVAEYEVKVPAVLSPAEEGVVTLEGTWPSDMTIDVTADKTVTLTNNIDGSTKSLNVNFNGISQVGNNTENLFVSETVSVDNMTNALYGTWKGTFYYNVIPSENTEVHYTYDVTISEPHYTALVTDDGVVRIYLDEDYEGYSTALAFLQAIKERYTDFINNSTYDGRHLSVVADFDTESILAFEFNYVGDGEYTIVGSYSDSRDPDIEPGLLDPFIITITRNSSNTNPGGGEDTDSDDEIVESPIYFDEFYGGYIDSEYYILARFAENGSAELISLPDGYTETLPEGALSYSGLNVIDNSSGQTMATVSKEGKSINYSGITVTLQETGVQYGESYCCSISEDGLELIAQAFFYEDGSAEIKAQIGEDTQTQSIPAGMIAYEGTILKDTSTGEMMGVVFDDGTKIFAMGLLLELGEPCFHEHTEVRNASDIYSGDTYCLDCGNKVSNGSCLHKNTEFQSAGKVCLDCGETLLSVHSCTHENTEVRDASDEYSGDTYCLDCGKLITKGGYYVPAGATYYSYGGSENIEIGDYSNATAVYSGGDIVPVLYQGDILIYGDYEYKFNYEFVDGILNGVSCEFWFSNYDLNGWGVRVLDNSKDSYGEILESFQGKYITSLSSTFRGCSSLTSAPIIPNSVTSLREAFYDCSSLEIAPTIPESVTDMYFTFYNCSALTTAPIIPSNVTDLEGTFKGCSSLVTAPIIPDSVTNMTDTFANCTALTTVPVIPNSVTNMVRTFDYCRSLTTAPVIPDSVTNMYRTFIDCTSLTTVPVIPASVTSMYETFCFCTSLTDTIIIPCRFQGIELKWSLCPATIEYKHIEGCSH